MNPWTTPAVVIRFVRIFPKVLTAGSAFEMWPTSSHPCPSMVGRTSGGIRRFAMVVEDFGDILFGNGKPMGPVYTSATPRNSLSTVLPEGAEFYDVTDGLTDATRSELFDAYEEKLEELEAARRVLTRIEKRWVCSGLSPNEVHAKLGRTYSRRY